MRPRDVVRRFPPLARRDEQLAALKSERKQLRGELHEARRELREARRELRETQRELRRRGRTTSGAWSPARVPEPQRLVRDSGLFDDAWYRSQLDEPPAPGTDTVEHYLEHGQGRGLSPHPAFVVDAYLAGLEKRRLERDLDAARGAALLHYLTIGAARGVSPHPLFDATGHLRAHPSSKKHPGGPLGHFLSGSARGGSGAGAAADAAPWDDPAEFQRRARAAAQALLDTRGHLHLERDRAEFDHDAETRLKADLREHAPLPDPPPLVSVIVPTKDRAALLPAALDSVLAQTYPHWQLVVVDDGSTDGTAELLERYAQDPRVEVVHHAEARGVAAARNAGLARAEGHYVAYLDSDNTWYPDFLELMVRAMHRDGHRVAYAMSALVEEGGEGRRLYRGMPYHRQALEERNYIDCIVLLHERSLVETVGGFDETLRRNVDWDLFLRMARESDFGFVPVVATEYDVWETRNERITSDEAVAYRYVVRQRTLLDWDRLEHDVDQRDDGLLSVVVVATEDAETLTTGVDRLLATATGPVEVVVVDSRLEDAEAVRLHMTLDGRAGVRLHRLTQALPLETARNVGASLTAGAVLAFLPETAWCEPDWDSPLREGLGRHVVVQPLVLSPGGAVWSAGAVFVHDGHAVLPYRAFAGDAPEVRAEREVEAVTAVAMAVDARRYVAARGFDPLHVRHHSGTELSLRLTADGAGTAACLPGSVVALRREPAAATRATTLMTARDNERRVRRLWLDQGRSGRPGAGHDGYRLVGYQRESNQQLDPVPLVVHDRPDRPLRWAVKIGAPTVERRTNWGDWHFAVSLRDSLERLGHEVTIDCKDEWYRPTAHLDDVVVHLRGVSVYEVNPGHLNIAWVISHPERVSATEMTDYDLVFGASPRWCRRTAAKLGREVEVLLQCTDHHRFHPVEPDRRRAHPVLVVANARGGRPAVSAALEAGIVPSVYGVRWEGLLPEGAWKGSYLPNHELPGVYAAAGVVLNDHWDDMRDHGILSNRLFDLAACDARVVSDHLPEVEEVFGDVVLTYDRPEELPDLIDTHLHETPARRAAREALGRRVREEHTFDARAATLSERVDQLRAAAAK